MPVTLEGRMVAGLAQDTCRCQGARTGRDPREYPLALS